MIKQLLKKGVYTPRNRICTIHLQPTLGMSPYVITIRSQQSTVIELGGIRILKFQLKQGLKDHVKFMKDVVKKLEKLEIK